MPRTIESIVDCHRAATDRHARGLPTWDQTIEIKHLLGADEHAAIEVGKAIAQVLRRSRWSSDDSEVAELAEFFDEIEADWEGHYEAPVDRLNALLDELYDRADYARVWIR
ncbi:hypothetical protein AXK58_24245 [Tsukamurella tyrosinosolvens]|uniref:Uncharacterized protein n=1 Tax=Tsukamurella tyrosinosolvens TaxID=57704 RepID=A0A1H4UMX2_TSUTY|nr:hypothetical protein [Tsukamurella tyrosinosolvens]KXO99068.1 hypothetical protein AXK58_24245 [Tsukamurella tyrosinosolvens]SEC69940.1 hypothetical protein SAMN04489793_2953 [Tsukamurella tyrosinosolvens]